MCLKYKTFRERSENADIATEIRFGISINAIEFTSEFSLQPWRRYGTDGCILFSDILTPLPSMGIDFQITEATGPKLGSWTSADDIAKIRPINFKPLGFVADTLKNLRNAVGSKTAVLGFVGMPFTLASYMVEGGSSEDYKKIKSFGYSQPKVLHSLLDKLAQNIGDYANFQIENEAQVVQMFDSWAGTLSPADYDTFALPYQRKVVERIKAVHPETPLIVYINKCGAVIEKMGQIGADIISVDWTTTIADARKRVDNSAIGYQGNLDPMALFAPDDVLVEQTLDILRNVPKGTKHIMNLGHGVDKDTSEEKVELFVKTVQNYRKP